MKRNIISFFNDVMYDLDFYSYKHTVKNDFVSLHKYKKE